MTNGAVAIKANDLNVSKNDQVILRSLNFTVPRGTVTGLIGPSGSGKTTLMRAIVGVQRFGSGSLEVLNESAGDSKLRPRVGYVTQSPSIYDDLTVEQNIEYFAAINRVGRSEAITVIDTVRLGSRRHYIVDRLSGGERARVSLAVALLGNPELLVLDEPTVGLDPILREELWGLFVDLAAANRTLLISSHVMDEAERCQYLLLMRDGELLWNDTKSSLLQDTATTTVGDAFIAKIERENV
jgi:ABC-2 type transport system ATP-binding protein